MDSKALARFARKYVVEDTGYATPCWVWTASKNVLGYGRFYLKRMMGAHRAGYLLLVGPVPEGLELDHLCRRPECVNPAHLEPVTHAENVRRGIAGENAKRDSLRRTHCKHGHVLTAENTRTRRGLRLCVACLRRRNMAHHRRRLGLPIDTPDLTRGARTHCPRGHAYDAANTYYTTQGCRNCRACQREKRGEASVLDGRLPPTRDRTHCPQGHAYDAANTIHARGQRKCRACNIETNRRRRIKLRALAEAAPRNSGTQNPGQDCSARPCADR